MNAAQRYCDAVNRGDAIALGEALAPGAVLHSPVSRRVTFASRDAIVALYRDAILTAVGEVHDEVVGGEGDTWFVRATGVAQGATIEEIIVIRLGDDGLIAEMTLHGRDLAASASLAAALAPRVAPPGWRRLVARLMTAPIAALLRRGDPVLVRLAGLHR